MAPNPVFQFRRYADLAEAYPFAEERTGTQRSLVLREPVGVVVAIPPFNGPLTLGAQKTAPALAAGCTVVLKAPNQDPLACFILAEVAEQAGLPPGVLNVLVADVAESEQLVSHPGVDKVSFTGSTAVGRRIGELCGRDIRRMTLELGGESRRSCSKTRTSTRSSPGSWAAALGSSTARSARCSRGSSPALRYRRGGRRAVERDPALPVGDPRDRETVVAR